MTIKFSQWIDARVDYDDGDDDWIDENEEADNSNVDDINSIININIHGP